MWMANRSPPPATTRTWPRCSPLARTANSCATSSRRTTGSSPRRVTTSFDRPKLIAHRGISRERPENTLPAFLRALELGADGIELDVHCTKNGVVVVHHDDIPKAKPPNRALAG